MNPHENDSVPVPAAVFDGLQKCQQDGRQDMKDMDGVLRWLRDDGWYAAADWVEQNSQTYLDGIVQRGLRPE